MTVSSLLYNENSPSTATLAIRSAHSTDLDHSPLKAVPDAERKTNISLDLDDCMLIRDAIALGIAVEVVSFPPPGSPDFKKSTWQPGVRPPHEIGLFEAVGQDGRAGASQTPSLTSGRVLISVPKLQTGGGHLITTGLFERGACIVGVLPMSLREDGSTDAGAIAAALGMPLDCVLTASLAGKCEVVGIVVEAASLDAVFAEAGEPRAYAANLTKEDRLILPGNRVLRNPYHEMGTRAWDAPAGTAAFLRALTAPPAKATLALARVLSGGSRRLREIMREQEQRGISDPTSNDDGDITLASQPSAQAPMILDGFIPRVGFGLLTGPSQAGKTWALASLFAHIARGASVAGVAAAQALTVHLTADDTRDDFLKRIQGFLHHHALSGAPYVARSVRDKPLPGQTGTLNLLNADHVAAVIAYVRQRQAEHGATATVVAFETMSKTMGDGDPANFRDVNLYQAALETISRELNAAVVVTHHPNKGGSSDYSGHGSIFNGADFLIVAEAVREEAIVLTAEKLKAGRDGATLSGQRMPFSYIDGNGHEVLSRVMRWERATPPGEPLRRRASQTSHLAADQECGTASEAPRSAAQAREAALLHAVCECLERGSIEHMDDGRLVFAARMEAVREVFRRLAFGDAETKPDTFNKAFRRGRDVLTASGTLRVSPDRLLIWIATQDCQDHA